MVDYEVVEYHYYCPPGVLRVLACGSSAFIGEVDDSTILKYPLELGGSLNRLELENKILTVVGQHPRVIANKGFTEAGLYLERAANGTVSECLAAPDRPPPSPRQRVAWCRELTEAVEHIHSRRVIHCDIQPTNVLIGRDMHLKLADFQGRHLSEHGDTLLDGWSSEPCRYFCPRDDESAADIQTDLFALGSTIYFIMNGQEVFADIISGEAGWEDEVKSRFARGIFPAEPHACAAIAWKCWRRQYSSAGEVLEEIRAVEQSLIWDNRLLWGPVGHEVQSSFHT